jgi:hypothetical protein
MRVVATLVVLAYLAACTDSDRIDAKYDTLGAALADGASARGWIPKWLPLSSVRIEESHNIDTNESSLSLAYSPSEGWGAPSSCVSVDPALIQDPGDVEGWLSGPPDISNPGYRIMRCEGGKAFLAFNSTAGQMYYWRPSGI